MTMAYWDIDVGLLSQPEDGIWHNTNSYLCSQYQLIPAIEWHGNIRSLCKYYHPKVQLIKLPQTHCHRVIWAFQDPWDLE